MATWHQQQAMKLNPSAYMPGDGWTVVSTSASSGMQSRMVYGDNETMARDHIKNCRKNDPDSTHYLWHNGRMVG